VKNNSPVAIIGCDDYSKVYDSISRAIELLGGAEKFFKEKQILLKPNLLKSSAPDSAIVTHPKVISAAVKIAADYSSSIKLGDSPSWGSARAVAEKAEYFDEESIKKISILEFKKGRYVHCKSTQGLDKIFLAKDALDSELIVNLPKFKTHVQMVMSGAVKNLFGCVVGKRKPLYHCLVRDSKLKFAHMLIDIMESLPPNLVIVDGVMVMEGNGPINGNPRKLGVIIAGTNPVSIDTVMAFLAGYSSNEIPVLVAAEERKYKTKIKEINLIGDDLKKFKTNIRRASFKPITFSPHRVLWSTIKGIFIKLAEKV